MRYATIRAATAIVALLLVLCPVCAAEAQATTDSSSTLASAPQEQSDTAAATPAGAGELAPDTDSPPATGAEVTATDPGSTDTVTGPQVPAPGEGEATQPKPAVQAERRTPSAEIEAEEDLPPPKPPISRGFVPGTHETALGLSTAGSGDYFYFGASGMYAYYVIKGLAPGIEVQYAHIFADFDYPDSLSLMPFLKYAFTVSETVAPYLLISGGRQFEWGAHPSYYQADSWFLGGGIGANIGLGERWAIQIQVLFLHHWYDGTKVYGHRDNENFRDVYNNLYWCESADCPFAQSAKDPQEDVTDPERPKWIASDYESNDVDCTASFTDPEERQACEAAAYKVCDAQGNCYSRTNDPKDVTREWIFPVISFGLSFVF